MREGSLEPFFWGVLNRLKLLDVERLQVVSVEEKTYEIRQVGIRKVSKKRSRPGLHSDVARMGIRYLLWHLLHGVKLFAWWQVV